MSLSLYGFVRRNGPVSPELVASELLALNLNGDARPHIEKVIGRDPRFLWEDGVLHVADPLSLALEE
ncbi:MAG TPA: hypothetical protein VHM16_02735, partial [Rubrobacteraceae bacterium]|nr:hypothetical protein [Rubrobacteraceae bacterium]